MKNYGLSARKAVGLVVIIALFISSASGTAQAYGFSRGHFPWSSRERVVVVLPSRAVSLREDSCYYYQGRYYKHSPRGYVIIPAPVGAVVPDLPAAHRTLVINGITYLEYDGVYYKGGPAGYTVVPIADAASTAVGSVAVAGQAPAVAALQNTAVINVPNKNGSYTPGTLQLASSGMYIGPQGEIYPNLPTAVQLQPMYGK